MLTSALAASGCSLTDAGTADVAIRSGPPVRLVVDTDLASDDLVALAFLLSSPHVEVRAITVSGTGEVRCPVGVDVARGLLALTGDEGVPVACGRDLPLAGDHAFPAHWRDAAGHAWGLDLPAVGGTEPEVTAVDLLRDSLRRGRPTLLTLGPLTNVAEAFRAEPALAGRVGSVVVMGGAVEVDGNVYLDGDSPSNAEWNVYVDPTAAAEVLASGAPVTLVGLDATNEAAVTEDFVERLSSGADTPLARMVRDLLAGNPLVASGGAYFWDPLAAAVVVAPGLVRTEDLRLGVVTEEGPDSGRVVSRPEGPEVAVAVDAEGGALEDLLLDTLSGGEGA